MRILDFERIKSPLHPPDSTRKSFTALLQLELCAQSAIAVRCAHSEHVRVQVRLWISIFGILTRLHSRQRHGETDHRFCRPVEGGSGKCRIEGANHLSAD